MDEYAELINEAGVPTDRIHFVATSASRDAKNRDEFFAGVEQRLGVLPDVISGDREAQLSFTGALSRVRPEFGPVLVMDIGGGSTEFIVGTVTGEMTSAVSLDIGSVRMTERFLKKSPPEPADRTARPRTWTSSWTARGSRSTGSAAGSASPAPRPPSPGCYLELRAVRPGEGARLDHSPGRGRRAARSAEPAHRRGDQGAAVDASQPRRRDHRRGLDRRRVAARTPVPELIISESDILDGIALELLAR